MKNRIGPGPAAYDHHESYLKQTIVHQKGGSMSRADRKLLTNNTILKNKPIVQTDSKPDVNEATKNLSTAVRRKASFFSRADRIIDVVRFNEKNDRLVSKGIY